MLSWMLNVEEAIGSHHEGKRPRDIYSREEKHFKENARQVELSFRLIQDHPIRSRSQAKAMDKKKSIQTKECKHSPIK